MKYLDEMDNNQLARRMQVAPWDDFSQELDNVNRTIDANVMIGTDLEYWFERKRLLEAHLGH